MRTIDRTTMAKKYRGKWVALKRDRRTVVASGTSVASALQAARKSGCDAPVITRIPQAPKHFIGYNRET